MFESKIGQLNVLSWQCTWKNVETHFHTQAHAHTPWTLGRGNGETFTLSEGNISSLYLQETHPKVSQIKKKRRKNVTKQRGAEIESTVNKQWWHTLIIFLFY